MLWLEICLFNCANMSWFYKYCSSFEKHRCRSPGGLKRRWAFGTNCYLPVPAPHTGCKQRSLFHVVATTYSAATTRHYLSHSWNRLNCNSTLLPKTLVQQIGYLLFYWFYLSINDQSNHIHYILYFYSISLIATTTRCNREAWIS